jgi:hypothetical protein
MVPIAPGAGLAAHPLLLLQEFSDEQENEAAPTWGNS